MIISDKYKYVYFSLPKTASVSISALLVHEFAGYQYGTAHHNVVMPQHCADYFKFTVVRNPYARVFSIYWMIKTHSMHRCHDMAKDWSFNRYLQWLTDTSAPPAVTMNAWDYEWKAAPWSPGDDALDDAILEREYMIQSIDDAIGRELTQIDLISYFLAANYMLALDAVLKFENLENQFRNLPFADRHVRLPFYNQALGGKPDWRSQYDSLAEQLVYRHSADDFELLEYDRGGL